MKKRCTEKVYPQERFGSFHPHQCYNKEWKDGFCKIHHPESIKKRKEKSAIAYQKNFENSYYMQLKKAYERLHIVAAERDNGKKAILEAEANEVFYLSIIEGLATDYLDRDVENRFCNSIWAEKVNSALGR